MGVRASSRGSAWSGWGVSLGGAAFGSPGADGVPGTALPSGSDGVPGSGGARGRRLGSSSARVSTGSSRKSEPPSAPGEIGASRSGAGVGSESGTGEVPPPGSGAERSVWSTSGGLLVWPGADPPSNCWSGSCASAAGGPTAESASTPLARAACALGETTALEGNEPSNRVCRQTGQSGWKPRRPWSPLFTRCSQRCHCGLFLLISRPMSEAVVG